MAWLLDPTSLEFGRQQLSQLGIGADESLLGVTINSEPFMLLEQPQLFEIMGRFLDAVIERYDVRVLFLCNEVREEDTYDKATSLKIKASMTHDEHAFILPNDYWAPQEMLSIVGCCRAMISTRYHSCVFSALQGVPFLALKRSDKVADLCWDMDWPYGTALGDLSCATLLNIFSEIEGRRSKLHQSLQISVRQMHERAMRNNVALESVVSGAAQ
jgi:polysaccharide pyruvyl transferase WcaK-like protein